MERLWTKSFIQMTIAIVVLAISNSLMGVVIAAALYGVGFGSAQPALQVAIK
ncbi:hypothetical protein [Bacillus fungorum]|uniref:hypothetical protein n=1 Tax=Bacillus fungorum TaxID=2039284 RepID=UPI001C6FCABC|nr:hypothetical protein [Bacillus fungorum]